MNTRPRGPESDSAVSPISRHPEAGERPPEVPYSSMQRHPRAIEPEQVREIMGSTASQSPEPAPKNDHQYEIRALRDALHSMIIHLQGHIDRAAAQAAAPRVAAALTRMSEAEAAATAWRQRYNDAEMEHARQRDVLKHRTAQAERMVMRCFTAIASCDDTGVPREHQAAWNAGWQACAAAAEHALNNPGSAPATPGGRHGRPAPDVYERQAIDRQSPDYHG